METKIRERKLLLGAAICIGLLFADRVLITPFLSFWTTRTERIEELETSLRKGRLLLERQEDLQTRWEAMQKNALPADPSIAQNMVLNAYDRWVRESRVESINYIPQWRREDENFMTLECRAVAQGNLEQIARFLYELETEPMALKVENFDITARDEKGDRLTLSIRFSGLRFVEESS